MLSYEGARGNEPSGVQTVCIDWRHKAHIPHAISQRDGTQSKTYSYCYIFSGIRQNTPNVIKSRDTQVGILGLNKFVSQVRVAHLKRS